MQLTHASLHYHIIKHIVDHGNAPKVKQLCESFAVARDDMEDALKALQEYHGVVLHPKSHEVWVMHPFSTAPTNFYLTSGDDSWWGNCAWCALGAAVLLDRDLTIHTTLGAQTTKATIEIRNGEIVSPSLYIHFPVPMVEAWDNVIYTCSTMLMFECESDIDQWCQRYGIDKGDVQPIERIWAFSKAWYGNHLNPQWQKWTMEEAKAIFQQYGLTSPIWQMPDSDGRF